MILVSFIIPTLNAGNVLESCLKSIRSQTLKNIEIIIADGGSIDQTINIARKYKTKIINNPLKTAEAGKAVGLRQTTGQFIALIDSDNILPSKNWLKKMLLPFQENPTIVGSEPIKFTYRKNGGFIERYSALLGANDPYAWFNGVYDRYSYLSNNWTGLKIDQIDKGQYIETSLKPNQLLPTIGANGTIFRADFLKKNQRTDYLFDVDILSFVINQTQKPLHIAKTKVGIIHTYCEASILKFIRKQNRHLNDFYTYQELRSYNWNQKIKLISLVKSNLKFFLYTFTILPALLDSFRGYLKKPDIAWFFHPFACLISLLVYTYISLCYLLGFHQPTNRQQWHQ